MKFKQLLGQYFLGILSTEELPGIAYKGLEEGFESPSLIILAGIEKNEDALVLEKYLKSTLDELNIIIHDKRTLTIEYAVYLANEITLNEIDIVKGVSDIIYHVLDRYNFYSEDKEFVYDSIAFEKVYSLYYAYDDLLRAKYNWSDKMSNKDLMIKVKNELREELKKWLLAQIDSLPLY